VDVCTPRRHYSFVVSGQFIDHYDLLYVDTSERDDNTSVCSSEPVPSCSSTSAMHVNTSTQECTQDLTHLTDKGRQAAQM